MFLEKDEKSKYDFISAKEFALSLFLMLLSAVFSFLLLPKYLKKFFPQYTGFFDSYYFGIFLFFLSGALGFYIIYYFCCKRKQKTLKDGLFLYSKSKKTIFYSLVLGIVMPLTTLPIILNFAPHEFYALDLAKTKDGLIYIFICAAFAPIFEEIFYRGFIVPFFQSKLNSFWAVLITALFFGFSHFMNIGNAHILLSLFIYYGFVLTLLRYFTNSLIPPMIALFVHNLTLISCFLFVSK